MPAAKPSKAAVSNILDAVRAHGLHPRAITIAADGTLRVELHAEQLPADEVSNSPGRPKKWKGKS